MVGIANLGSQLFYAIWLTDCLSGILYQKKHKCWRKEYESRAKKRKKKKPKKFSLNNLTYIQSC